MGRPTDQLIALHGAIDVSGNRDGAVEHDVLAGGSRAVGGNRSIVGAGNGDGQRAIGYAAVFVGHLVGDDQILGRARRQRVVGAGCRVEGPAAVAGEAEACRGGPAHAEGQGRALIDITGDQLAGNRAHLQQASQVSVAGAIGGQGPAVGRWGYRAGAEAQRRIG